MLFIYYRFCKRIFAAYLFDFFFRIFRFFKRRSQSCFRKEVRRNIWFLMIKYRFFNILWIHSLYCWFYIHVICSCSKSFIKISHIGLLFFFHLVNHLFLNVNKHQFFILKYHIMIQKQLFPTFIGIEFI